MEQTAFNILPDKLWNKSYMLVLLVSTFSAFAFYMVATIMSKYLIGLGVGVELAGVIVGLFSITSLFCRPFCGLMTDRLNNAKLILWSNVLMSAGLLGFAFSQNIPLLILFRVCSGVGFAISGTAQIALAIQFIPKGKTGEGIGYMGISQLIGSACAPAAGLAIAELANMRATFICAAALPILASFLLLFLRNLQSSKPSVVSKARIAWRDIFEPKALPFTLPYSTLSFINGMIASYLVLFADEIGVGSVSIYFTLYAVCLFLVRPVCGKLMDRKGLKYTVFPGLLITAVSMFLLPASASLGMILLTGVLRAVGQGAAQPSLQAGCINHVGREKSGVATSTYFLGGDIGQGISPMIGGFVLAGIVGLPGYRFIFILCGCLNLAAFLYFFIWCKKERYS